jgi:RNA polymerase sigma factor (TIGR02999 family)
MRHILVDHAKRRQAAKRGGGQIRLSLDEALDFAPERDAHLVALDEALTGLSSVQAELCRIVELRFFGGLTVEETSRVMGMSPKTVQRKWALARSWLHREITRS